MSRAVHTRAHFTGCLMILCLMALSFSVLPLTGCTSDRQKAADHLESGKAYAREKQFNKARIEFLNATRLEPENSEAWFQLAETLMHTGKAPEAFQAYTRAEKIEPDNSDILLKTAGFYLVSNQINQADSRVSRLLAKHPEDTRVLFLKGQILIRQKAFADAAAIFEKILQLAPDHIPAHEKLATLKTREKQYDAAEELLKNAVNIDKERLSSRITLFSFYVGQGRYPEAQAVLTAAAQQFPDNLDIPILSGNLYLKTGNKAAAETAYKRTLALAPDEVKPHLALARFYDYTEKPDKALTHYTRALELQPDNDVLKATLARIHLQNNRLQEAEEIITPLLAARPNFFPALLLDSNIKIIRQNYPEALAQLERLEKERPESAEVYFLSGLVHMARSDTRKAINTFEKALERNPAHTGARLRLAKLYYDDSAFDRARQNAIMVLEDFPLSYIALDIKANCDMETGHKEEALKGFRQLISLDPENPRGYELLGLFFSYEKQYDQADRYLEKALERAPLNLNVIRTIIRNDLMEKQPQKALERIAGYLTLPDASPRFKANLFLLKGDIHKNQEKETPKAFDAYDKALDIDPDFRPAALALARLYMETGNREKALEEYTRLIEKDPTLVIPHMMTGILLDAQGDHETAAQHYRKALEINPRYAPAANNLAVHLIKRAQAPDKALAWIRVAREMRPEDPAIMDTLGLIYLEKGLTDSAVAEFEESLRRTGDNPEVLLHLGRAYLADGNGSGARQTLEKLIGLAPDSTPAAQAQDLLKNMNEN